MDWITYAYIKHNYIGFLMTSQGIPIPLISHLKFLKWISLDNLLKLLDFNLLSF